MIYLYDCSKCQLEIEIIKSMKDASREEHCDSCGNLLERIYLPPHITGAKVENAEFNHGLGCVTKNKYDRAEKAKRKGLIEVGNENPDSMAKEAKKTLDKKLSWENV
jgi:hypothetical protein